MLKRQNRMYKNFKRHGFSEADRERVQRFREHCNQAVQTAKEKYLRNIGENLQTLTLVRNAIGVLFISY